MRTFIIAAQSADGFIGANTAQSSLEWRSREDGQLFTRLTKEAGVMIMGATTYKTFRVKRAPPGRRLIIYTNHPDEIIGEHIETTAEEPGALLARLEREGTHTVAVCGGGSIDSLFLDAGLVDELYLTIEPVLFGQGVPLLRTACRVQLRLLNCQPLNPNSLLLHYAVQRSVA